jgi:hypothetical protein
MESNKTLALLSVLLVGLVLATALVFVNSSPPPEAEGPPRFLVCPNCGFDRPYLAKAAELPCPQCKASKMVATSHSRKVGGGGGRPTVLRWPSE